MTRLRGIPNWRATRKSGAIVSWKERTHSRDSAGFELFPPEHRLQFYCREVFRSRPHPFLHPISSGTVLIVGERVMSGFGAIVKSITKVLEDTSSVAVFGLRLALGAK